MYFDNCSSKEEMVQTRDNLFTAINDEFKNKSRQLNNSKTKGIDTFIKKNRDIKEDIIMFMAFPINKTKGKRNEVIFNSDGTVTI